MALARASEEFVTTNAGVDFLMEDGNIAVSCRAAREGQSISSLHRVFDGDVVALDSRAQIAHRAGNNDRNA